MGDSPLGLRACLINYNSVGGANGVAEMILQSHNGEIHLLPALPASWTEGSVRGFRARGGFEVDIAWTGGQLSRAEVRSTSGTFSRVRYAGSAVDLAFDAGAIQVLTASSF